MAWKDRRYKHRVFLFIIQRPAGSAKMEVRLIAANRYLFNFLKYLQKIRFGLARMAYRVEIMQKWER